MSDDMSLKLQQLKDMLNNTQIPDNLKDMMSLISNNSPQGSDSSGQNTEGGFNISENAVLIDKVRKVMSKRNTLSDPRINLLNAIKPYLNDKRQSRINSCTKILNYSALASVFKDED